MAAVLKPPPATPEDVKRRVDAYVVHLRQIEQVFNQHAQELGLGVRLSAAGAIKAAQSGTGTSTVIRFADREDDSGVLHGPQLMTALDCVGELLTSPNQ